APTGEQVAVGARDAVEQLAENHVCLRGGIRNRHSTTASHRSQAYPAASFRIWASSERREALVLLILIGAGPSGPNDRSSGDICFAETADIVAMVTWCAVVRSGNVRNGPRSRTSAMIR